MRWIGRLVVLAGLWGLPAGVQAQAVVEGVVTDARNGRGLPDATVLAVGTNRTVQTGQDGRYRLIGLSAGLGELRAMSVGYAARSLQVMIPDSGVVTVNFQLQAASAVLLDEIVVTAVGGSNRRRENGASVDQLVPDSIPATLAPTFSDLITARTSGVVVLHSGGSTGMGSRVRIRGSNSMVLSNEPLYVIDGIRIDNSPATFFFETGDESPSRLDDIDPSYLQTVDVIKGPAAAALYGTAAANGVIQLQTRQGHPGPAQWTGYIEAGAITNAVTFPTNYGLWTNDSGFEVPAANPPLHASPFCNLVEVADGNCIADSLAQYNPLEQNSPFRTGYRTKFGLSVGGGAPSVTYFFAGNVENEAGVSRVNDLSRRSLRGNITTRLSPNLDVSLLTGFLHRNLGVPQNGFTFLGPIFNGIDAPPFGTAVDSTYHKPTFGYSPVGPDQFNQVDYSQETDHFTGAINATWRPRHWLTLTGVTGLEDIQQVNRGVVPAYKIFLPEYITGLWEEDRSSLDILTANWSAAAQFPLTNSLLATVTGGTQYFWQKSEGVFNSNATGTLHATERGFEDKTLGALLSAQFGWRDRVFLTGALRSDWSSGFGHQLGGVVYPGFMGSWVISDESFFPRGSFLASLRLRAAYGQSGLLPGSTDQLTILPLDSVPVGGVEVPGVTAGQLANPHLKPERVAEIEAGFDAELANGRITLEATYYNKRSNDALVQVPLAGSIGNAQTQLQNIGDVRNEGVELGLGADLVRSRTVLWSMSVSVSGNRNRLLSLAGGLSSLDFNGQQRFVPGYPLGGFWATPPVIKGDVNGDGMIGNTEVSYDDFKPKKFIGSALPTRSIGLRTSLNLPGGVRLWTQFDYQGGHYKFDFSDALRCRDKPVCAPLNLMTAPLADKEQAALAYLYPTYRYGFIEDASFLKWRELAVEWQVPTGWAHWVGSRSMLVSLAVRNVETWTRYPGLDPEATRSQDNFRQTDFYTQPQVRYFVTSMTVGF